METSARHAAHSNHHHCSKCNTTAGTLLGITLPSVCGTSSAPLGRAFTRVQALAQSITINLAASRGYVPPRSHALPPLLLLLLLQSFHCYPPSTALTDSPLPRHADGPRLTSVHRCMISTQSEIRCRRRTRRIASSWGQRLRRSYPSGCTASARAS